MLKIAADFNITLLFKKAEHKFQGKALVLMVKEVRR